VLFGPFLKENAGKWPQMMKKLNIFVTFERSLLLTVGRAYLAVHMKRYSSGKCPICLQFLKEMPAFHPKSFKN
jgi:hypothetical protein